MARTHAEDVLELPKVLSKLGTYCQINASRRILQEYTPFSSLEKVQFEYERIIALQKAGISVQLAIPAPPRTIVQELQSSSTCTIELCVALKKWFKIVQNLRTSIPAPIIKKYFTMFGVYDDIEKDLSKIMDDAGVIVDTASSRLQQLRSKQKQTQAIIEKTLTGLLGTRAPIFSDTMVVERNKHYVLPVKRNFKKDLPGVVHAYSNSGETVFIEPLEITEHAAQLVVLEQEENEEIEHILRTFTDKLRPYVQTIEKDIDTIIDIDICFAKIAYGKDLAATIPEFSDDVVIVNGLHPLLKQVCEDIVPLNVSLPQDQKILLISGPNAGGKTVVLKTVGLIALMAKCGMMVPVAEGSRIPFFDRVYADIGDEQSIESQLSTFAAHLVQIKQALDAGSSSLVLLDELMSQTSVEEGSALAMAILDTFSKQKSWVFATTHNENLKLFARSRPDMQNGGMEYIDRPTYRLILGVPQASNAIRLAQNVGINHGVIDQARTYMDEEKVGFNELFEDLSQQSRKIEKERKQLADLKQEYESKLADFNAKKKGTLQELKAKYKKNMIQSKRSIERLIKDLKKQGATPEKIRKARSFFREKLTDETKHPPYHPIIGEIVRVRDLRKNGQVVEKHGGQYKVSLDTIFYWLDPEDIEKVKK